MRFSTNGQIRQTNGDTDHRVRISVFLVSASRPKYWSFHCNYCGTKICELSGEEVMLSDVDDMSRYQNQRAPINIRCTGKFCKMWYELNLN